MTAAVLVYRDRLTYLSERFILAQGEALARHQAHYVGVKREADVDMPAGRMTLLADGSLLDLPRLVAFKLADIVPPSFRQLRMLKPVLVHAHFGPDGVQAIALARAVDAPLIVSFHGFDATMDDRSLRAMPIRAMRQYPAKRHLLQRTAARFIAVSEFIRRKLVAQGFPEQRVVVHYVGVDTKLFAARGAAREQIVLFVGRVIEQKGIADFVRAIADLRLAGLKVRAVVVGDGPARLEAMRLSVNLNASIEFVGAQNQDTVRVWMQRSHVFCVPSRRMATGAEEGFGLVFAEAQAAGLPVVAYDSGGIPEAVAHRKTGLLATDGDWRTLAANLAEFLTDWGMHDSFSRAAEKRARELFDLRERTAALERTYDDVATEYRERFDLRRRAE